ncbi:MAG: FGGY-family carbohydrate kinase [Emergencia sp.]
MKPLVLTFDIGTQSLRAVLVDDEGNLLCKKQTAFEKPYFSLNPGWAEQRGEFYWENICRVSRELKEEAGPLWQQIRAVSITTIRDTDICIGMDGKPVRPAILWLDKRETETDEPFPAMNQMLFAAAGMTGTASFIRKISHCNWIRHNEPETWEKTYKYMMLSGYMNYCFTGEMKDCTANIIGHVPYDNRNSRWQTPKDLTYCVFPIPREKLCDLCEPGDIIGHITAQASAETGIPEGLPLIATGSDKGCETIGLSCTTPEKAAVSFGTTATIQYTIDRYVEPQRFFPPYVAAYKGRYNPEIEIYRGYWLISWFKREFAEKEEAEAREKGMIAEELLNRRLAEIPPGCDGLVFQPYFTPGVSMPEARGSVIGFSDVHTRIHIYRAIIEGINFALIDGMKTLEKRMKTRTEGVYVAGGGSRSSEICQITADMFGLPVHRIQTHEAAVIGSSAIAFTGIGHFDSLDEAIASMVHIRDIFEPDMEVHKTYDKIFSEIFVKIFDKLKSLYSISREMEEKHVTSV